jgi:hypothetical protein
MLRLAKVLDELNLSKKIISGLNGLMPLRRSVARFNLYVTNRILGPLAKWVPGMGVRRAQVLQYCDWIFHLSMQQEPIRTRASTHRLLHLWCASD